MILAIGTIFSWDNFILLTIKSEKMSDLWFQNFTFFFVNKAHSPSWVRRSRHLMPTKSKRRRKKRRKPELSTRSQKKPFSGSWRTMRRWHLPPDTSKCCSDLTVNSFFSLHWFVVPWIVNIIMQMGTVKGHLWFVHTIDKLQHSLLPIKLLWPVSAHNTVIEGTIQSLTNLVSCFILPQHFDWISHSMWHRC